LKRSKRNEKLQKGEPKGSVYHSDNIFGQDPMRTRLFLFHAQPVSCISASSCYIKKKISDKNKDIGMEKREKTMKYGQAAIAEAKLEPWPNPSPERDYLIEISFPEFTCLCPRSGYPDFATIKISYIPADLIVELKSLKLYLNGFRDIHISHEEATNRIFSDLSKTIKPKSLTVVGDFHPRGNVHTVITVEEGWDSRSSV